MPGNHRWRALLDPGKATDFFDVDGDRPALDVHDGAWHRGTAWWCAEISRAIYRRDDRPTFFARAGLRELRFFEAGSMQAALLTHEACAVLVFRGSDEVRDWLTNVRATPVAWSRGGRVHEGFANGFAALEPEIAEHLQRLAQPRLVTGHSLGGALATLAASTWPFAAAYTFGAPRVGDEAFHDSLRAPLHRVVHGRDVVTRVPPERMGYRDAGQLHRIGEQGTSRAHAIWDHAPIGYSQALLRPPGT